MSKKQSKERLVTCIFIGLLIISAFSGFLEVPAVFQAVQAQGTTIFSDNFASGNLNAWSGTYSGSGGSTPIVQSSVTFNGSAFAEESVLGSTAGAYSVVYKDFSSAYTSLYATAAVYFTAFPNSGCRLQLSPSLCNVGDSIELATAYIYNNGGTIEWNLLYQVNGGLYYAAYGTPATLNTRTWYQIGVSAIQGNGNGSVGMYVNGALVLQASGLQNNALTMQEVDVGAYNSGASAATLYVDQVAVTNAVPSTDTNQAFYNMSGASHPISGNPTDQHGFQVVHTTNIVQCNMTIDGAPRTYLAYDSNEEGSLINLYYSNSINGTWIPYSANPILSGTGQYRTPSVALVNGTFQMFLNNLNNKDIERWTSTNGIKFTKAQTVLTTTYDEWTNPFIWLNPNDGLWYLLWVQGQDSVGRWEIMARNSSSITGLGTRSDTVVMDVTFPYNTAFPTIMYTGGEYWLLTEAETNENSGLWRVNAWYSASPTSGYSLSSNSPILTNDEACPQIFLSSNNVCYLFTNQNQNGWYQEVRTVYFATTVTVSPSSWTMDVGQSKTFTAIPSGGTGSYTSYQWYVGGVAQSGLTASTFSFSPASAGSYSITAKVTDSSGATSVLSTAALVTVAVSPTVNIAPAGLLALDASQSQTFTATPTGGSGTIHYQWYLGASAVSGGTNSMYSFNGSVGSYSVTCRVTDSASTPVTSPVSNAVTITVAASLIVSISPNSAVLDVGQSAMFTATASGGTGSLNYQWYLNSVLQNGATSNFTYIATATGTFAIYVQVTDSASTHVTSKSNSSTIKVNSVLAAPTASASPTTIDQGQTSSLNSTATTTGTFPYTYRWYSKAPNADSYSLIGGANSSSCSFTTSSSTTTGTWSFDLQITDSSGASVTSNAVTITVNAAAALPSVSVSPSSWTMVAGQSKIFSASASGGSGTYVSYQWYVNGVAQYGQTASTYTLMPIASGVYSITVTVTDSSSTTSPQSSAATVTVSSSPTVSVSPSSWTMVAGQSKIFSASASGGSGTYVSYQWYVNGVAQSGQNASTYSFAPVAVGCLLDNGDCY